MPYSTEIIDNGKGILHVGTGRVSGQDLAASALAVLKLVKEGLVPEYGLTDLSGVTEFSVTADDIERNAMLNNNIARLLPSAKVAIIAPADDVYGMVRMWQAHMDRTGWTSKVFRFRSEAIAWLKEGTGG